MRASSRRGGVRELCLWALALAGCATVVLEGPEGIGPATAAGRGRALASARSGRGLLSSPVPFTLDVAGGEEAFQWAVPAVDADEVVLEQRAGLWVALSGGVAQSGRCGLAVSETADASSPEADEALGRAQTQAARKLARASVSAPEGRFRGSVVVERRQVRVQGRKVEVTLTGCVTDARAEALSPVDACRLALTGLTRHTGEAARWKGLAVRCPATMAEAITAAAGRWQGLDEPGRRALVDGLSSTLERPAAPVAPAASQAVETPAPRGVSSPRGGTTVPPADGRSASAATVVTVATTDASAPVASPAPIQPPATPGVVVNVTVNTGGPATSTEQAIAATKTPPPASVPPCPAGAVRLGSGRPREAAFCLDRTEVSEKAYRGYGSRRPAVSVSWREATAFCARLGGRLPSESEWVRAAAGDAGRVYPWGEAPPVCDRVNSSACEGVTRVVDAPGDVTPEGLHGLGGNVSEWTADAWGADRPGARVVRGGAFNLPSSAALTSFRTGRDWSESYRDGGLGFRCAYAVREGETSPAPK